MEVNLVDLKGNMEFINAGNLVNLPRSANFGSLLTKQLKIIDRLQHVNTNIQRLHFLWETVRISPTAIFSNYHILIKEVSYLPEEIIYHLKICCDEIIGLCWFLEQLCENDKIPSKVEIGSIGEYISKANSTYKEFDNFVEILEKINDFANAYKHSFTQSDMSIMGQEEPCFFALYTKCGKLRNTHEMGETVNGMIREFNTFYSYYEEYLEKLCQKLGINDCQNHSENS